MNTELLGNISSMDRIKYRRMLPVCLAEMYSLESSDPVIWEAFTDGEFSVQTNQILFTGIGMVYRGEQVNKTLKIDGGISRNKNARTRYILNAPLLAEIADNFKKTYKNNNDKSKRHYQLTKAYTKRHEKQNG